MPNSWARRGLIVYVGTLGLIGCFAAVLLARGWWPDSPRDVAGLGATAERCNAAFGSPWEAVEGSGWDSAKNVLYVKGAWYVHVGFNDAGRAEQFVFCKAKLPLVPSARLSAAEQQALLDRLRDGSSWSLVKVAAYGPQWERADKKAYASYLTERRWLVVMDQPCLERKFKSLPGHMELELSKP